MDIWIWLIIVIVLSVLEASTVSLVSIWFIMSGIVSLILSIFKVDFSICFAVFVLLGAVLMLTTRKSLVKIFNVKNETTNLDRIIGKKALVTEDIEENKIGEVKVDGKKWSAYSDEYLQKGTLVKVLEINSVKLKVQKWED